MTEQLAPGLPSGDLPADLQPADLPSEDVPVVAEPTPSDGVTLAPLGEEHGAWMADVHVTTLPHGLFPRLGRRFVRRWHAAQVSSPYGTAHVAQRDGSPIGFLLGSTDRRAGVAWVLQHRRGPLVRAAVAALGVRPRLLLEFLSTRSGAYLRRLGRRGSTGTTGATGAPGAPETVAVLEAIVVSPEARGIGVGTRLVERFLEECAEAGVDRVELVTKAGAGGAAPFYERIGWTRVGSHADRDGDEVITYRAPSGRR